MAAALAAVAFLCVVVLVCLLPAYWASRNIAMLALIWWLVLCNVIQGINAVVWAGNVDVRIPVWCDIGTKLLLGVRLAVPATCLCLSNRVRHLLTTGDAKGGIGILSFDLTMCIIVPIIYMALHIIVQGHRFNLTKNFGCSPAVYNTIPALFLVWLPPLILSMFAIMLACITTYCGHRRAIASMPRPPSIFRPSNIPGHLPDVPPPATTIDPMEHRSLTQNEAWQLSSRRRPVSIVAGPWPRPPSSIPTSPVNSGSLSSVSSVHPAGIPSAFSEQVMSIPMPSHVAHWLRPPSDASVNTSPAPSTISNSAYIPDPPPLHDSPTLPHFPPFADASIPAEQGHTLDPGQGAGLPKRTRRTRSRDGLPILTRNMSLSGLRGRENRPEGFDGGAIYMTVVQETA
ncbi:hypothetical protein DAEQUDRAFT_671191 [Daedalea quercina L-15889]|uniref:STE3-domain-containing protein n=1 Tax=Daedalea quercina L-15889 TaxID=1314783 RepID=A0A165PTR3_9APHY|nr:hypothetical protein DAEQUDRAFT_671191 [Daedalea quercina L-15889]